MSQTPIKNLPASVRQRLLNLAQEQKLEFQLVLTHFAIERLLYRLQHSTYGAQFILKGAMLFRVWEGSTTRITRDLDLLGFGDSAPEAVAAVFRTLATMEVSPDDGLVFDTETVRAAEIRDNTEYRGVRVRLAVRLEQAQIPLQVDVGFGDVVTPEPELIDYPTLLDLPAPTLRAYPRETVVAEKFQAIVSLSTANTRVKDFYDIWHLSERLPFDGAILSDAIHGTFQRRETPLPVEPPLGLSPEYLNDPDRARQWSIVVARSAELEASLVDAGHEIVQFVMPTVRQGFTGRWPPGGPWQGESDA